MKRAIMVFAGLVFLFQGGFAFAEQGAYAGSKACQQCHPDEYESYQANSKKSHSFDNIKKMETKLTPEEYKGCFKCHTTGYGSQGGFVSESQTPDLKNPGCEVCHGPGLLHAQTEDAGDITRKMDVKDCMVCHSKERINDFDFRPLLYSGGH